MMDKKTWQRVVDLWTHKTSQWTDNIPDHALYGVILHVVRLDSLGQVKWGAADKDCGICAARVKIMNNALDLLRKSGDMTIKTLVVGNATVDQVPNVEDYDLVVSFNWLRNEWVRPYLTHHWMRSNTKETNTFGGEEIAPIKNNMTIVLCDVNHQAAKIRKFTDKGCGVHEFRVRSLCPTYPPANAPSTGFAAIKFYAAFGHKVTATGFTWSGSVVHDWRYEQAELHKMREAGQLTLINCKEEEIPWPKVENHEPVNGIPYIQRTPGNLAKKGHWCWLNYDVDGTKKELSFAEYVSIRSFQKHHKDWELTLHTNCNMAGENYERLTKEFGLKTRTWKLDMLPAGLGEKWKSHKSDWIKAYMLYTEGGVSVDLSDTVTIRNVDHLLQRANRYQAGKDAQNRFFHTGFIMVNRPGDEAFRKVLEWCGSKEFLAANARAAIEHFTSALFRNRPTLFEQRWEYSVAYPVHFTMINNVIQTRKVGPFIRPDTVQVHWYTAADGTCANTEALIPRRQCLAEVTRDNWKTLANAFGDSIRIAMGNITQEEI